MKIVFLTIGKTVNSQLISLQNDYQERIKHYNPFDYMCLPEVKNTKSRSESEQKELEADIFMKYFEPNDWVVLLDEHGKQFTSVQFADFLYRNLQGQHKRLIFVVGGPYGFAKRVYDRSNAMISLSAMTFSHQMVRTIFVEQLYRAFTIQKGEPYHHQ